jgi:DNA primase
VRPASPRPNKVTITYARNGETQTAHVTLSSRSS